VEITTSAGPAVVSIDRQAGGPPRFLLALTHGAAGGVDSPDLLAAAREAAGRGGLVARVLQPYRVRGARAPGSPPQQDTAWLEIVAALRRRVGGLPLIQGGRSNGARVACRTAVQAGALAVLALAFPLHPPGRPGRSRAGELRAAAAGGASVLVVSGARDPFGIPEAGDGVTVVVLPDEGHSLRRDPQAISAAVGDWIDMVAAATAGSGAAAG
jgi:predicted alpha/beta-hydrolase family hydrolase